LENGGDAMYKNLAAEMARYDITTKMIADCLGVNERTVRNYLSGRTQISWPDVIKIKNEFFPDLEISYLFATTSEKTLNQ
jgi:plasmid maintenance system antidote protein VapI